MPLPLPYHTARLTLRRFTRDDAAPMVPLISDYTIAEMTSRIPHPYTEQDAHGFINMLEADPEKPILCIALRATGQLIGAIGLELDTSNDRGELGYWVGRPFWNQGYATEAAASMLTIAFSDLKLHKVTALHYTKNPASGRVLGKIGMRREGLLVGHTKRFGKYEDSVAYGLTAPEFAARC